MKRTAFALIAVWYVVAITGCNTMQGLGQDVQKTGEKIEDAAAKKK